MSKNKRPWGPFRVSQDLQKSKFNPTWESDDEKCYSSRCIDLFSWNLLEEKENVHPITEAISIQCDHIESNGPASDFDQY